MPQFDPRQSPIRIFPRLLTGAAGVGALFIAWQGANADTPPPTLRRIDVAAYAALEQRAFAAAETRPGYAAAQTVPVTLKAGESLTAAIRRVGVDAAEARTVAEALAPAFEGPDLTPVTEFEAAVTQPELKGGDAQLIALSMRTGPASVVTLARTFDGDLRLRETREKILEQTTVAEGAMDGSFYESTARAGVDRSLTTEAIKLLGAKVDFGRDVKAGDPFRLVFDQRVTESGRLVETGDLLYAELNAKGRRTLFYRFNRGGRPEWFDQFGRNTKGFLLRTPVDGARVTSSFGMRRHPIWGYSRMHQGIDFGAGSGTPIYAAGDGVVVEARRWGGYGNWLRIRHAGGWETGYGHLSAYARGLKAGQRVAQGQVVAFVGSTGASTGPHLHYETWHKGQRTDPRGAKIPVGTVLAGRELQAFRTQKAKIDRALGGVTAPADAVAPGETPMVEQASLRGEIAFDG